MKIHLLEKLLEEYLEKFKNNPLFFRTKIGKMIRNDIQRRGNWRKKARSRNSAMPGFRKMRYIVAQNKGDERAYDQFIEEEGL